MPNNIHENEVIFNYDIDKNPDELKAYRLAILWQEIGKKEFPDHAITRIKKYGDPRKSTLFKYCYKLVIETRGLIADEDYPLYIRAQFQIFKKLSNFKQHALIDPQILVGDKAFRRWQYWKNRYDFKFNNHHQDIPQNSTNILKIHTELEKTKLFLLTFFGRNWTKDDLCNLTQNKILAQWLNNGKVSPFYFLLSPFINKIYRNIDESLGFNFGIYRESIDTKIQEEFTRIFSDEFNTIEN